MRSAHNGRGSWLMAAASALVLLAVVAPVGALVDSRDTAASQGGDTL
jgi:succinate dehydrogenase hydrophobic anchor subunit